MPLHSKHTTLSGTTVATVSITGGYDLVEVLNRGDVPIYFRTDGTNPTSGGDDTTIVMPGDSVVVPLTTTDVKLIGNANDYSVQGVWS